MKLKELNEGVDLSLALPIGVGTTAVFAYLAAALGDSLVRDDDNIDWNPKSLWNKVKNKISKKDFDKAITKKDEDEIKSAILDAYVAKK